jgi:hypothetical protein
MAVGIKKVITSKLKHNKMNTIYPKEKITFNQWASYVKQEVMKQYANQENKQLTTECSFGKNQKQ